ncbi:MAG: OsmC family protein [Spirochaetota bacterium]
MSYITRAEHTEGLAFRVDLQGHEFMVDADEQFGGKDRGPRPKALMLSALAGCTGMDVASILGKMQMPYDSFALEISAEQTDEHPKVYREITVRYIFTGSELDRSKIEKAVKLSQEKYCGVSAMLAKTATINTEIVTE